MTCGIYCYIDLTNNKIVYIGKDSNIDRNIRHKQHFHSSTYNKQPFNRVLQNNPDRYEYKVLKKGDFKENFLNALEIIYIKRYKTYRPQTGHGFNFTIGGDGMTGYKASKETKIELAKAHNSTGYFRVMKRKNKSCSHGFDYVYQYTINGTRKLITRADFERLRQKVLLEGLEWFIIDKENADKTYNEYLRNIKKTNEFKNKTGFYRVSIIKRDKRKQSFSFVYQYQINNKRKQIKRKNLYELKEKVLQKNLEWRVISKKNAKKMCDKYNYNIEKLR